MCIYSVIAWLFNPFTFTIGTRGNCEPIVCAVILWIITCIMRGKVCQAAIWYGFIVHFRIYPIIYALPLVLVLDPRYLQSGQKAVLMKWSSRQVELPQSSDATEPRTFCAVLVRMLSGTRILFGLISGGIFLGCTGLFYYLYGMEFLHEALLYHLTRADPRHNFSMYFYHIYLNYERELSIMEKLVSFLPQFAVQLVLIFCFALDLPFCFLAQTVAFVAFNKVITAQYFVWFFCLLPVVMPWSKMKLKWQGLFCMLCWMGTQLHWLLWGYLLEFKGKNVFLQLWIGSLLFLAANIFVLVAIIRHHRYCPIFRPLNFASKGRLKVR